MREPWGAASDRARLEPDTLALQPPGVGLADVQRRLEERLARLNEGGGERIETPGRLLFWIEGAPYSAALSALRGALPNLPEITSLPLSPAWLVGLFPLRTDLVTLIDLGLALRTSSEGSDSGAERLTVARHALLIGEAGRLIAFLVDRIGDIYSDALPAVNPGGNAVIATPGASAYIETVHQAPTGDAVVAGLDLTRIYGDVMAKLEAWARDA